MSPSNVVTVYAHDPSHDCIVMEFLDGASLSTLLEKGIDRVNAIRVALAVADALAAVHRRLAGNSLREARQLRGVAEVAAHGWQLRQHGVPAEPGLPVTS